MRISDWSSDVCSSDLGAAAGVAATRPRSLGDAAAGGHVAREVVPHRRARRKERSLPVVQGWIWARGRRRPAPRKRGCLAAILAHIAGKSSLLEPRSDAEPSRHTPAYRESGRTSLRERG